MTESEGQVDGVSDELAQLQRALASVYKVERLLVRRGTTIVYQAAEINPPRPVALRVFPAELNLAPVAERFRELARLLVALNHPNILPIYRIVFRGGVPYLLATKLAEGRHLDEVLASQGALQLPLAITVLRAAAAALAFAHEHGVVHGALTTTNILLDRDGHVLVENFGIARAIEDTAPPAEGRPRVAAPEEAAGALMSPAGDQYALGIVALEMLSGSGQFGGDPLASLREVRTARVALPDALVKILRTVLMNDSTQRFAGSGDLLAALQAIAFSEAEVREATVGLGRLARGEPVPKLRAVASPPTGVTTARPMRATPGPTPPPAVLELEAAAPPPAEPAPVAPPVEPVRARVPSSPAMPAPDEPMPAEPAPPAEPAVRAAPIMRVSGARESGGAAGATVESAPKRRSRLVWVLAALVIVAVLGAGAYLLLGRRPAVPMAQAPAPAAAPAPAVPVTPTPAAVAAESARSDTTHKVAAAADTSTRTGQLVLNVDPSTAIVYVDGTPTGSGGLVDTVVAAGRRHLTIVASGFNTFDTTITVRRNTPVDLGEITLHTPSEGEGNAESRTTGLLRLTTVPPTAQIFVDEQAVGTGALADFQLSPGTWKLRISAPGYATFDTVITMTAGAKVHLGEITLKSNP